MELAKIIDVLEESQGMIDEAMADTKHQYLKTQLGMASSNCKSAIQLLKEAIRTEKEITKEVAGGLDKS